jgi:hypothetical protein
MASKIPAVILVAMLAACTAVTAPDGTPSARAQAIADSGVVLPPSISFTTSLVDVSRTADSKTALYHAPSVILHRGTAALPDSVTLSFSPNSGLTCADRGGIFATSATVRVAAKADSVVVPFPLAICPTVAGQYYTMVTGTLRASVTLDSVTRTATATVKIRRRRESRLPMALSALRFGQRPKPSTASRFDVLGPALPLFAVTKICVVV